MKIKAVLPVLTCITLLPSCIIATGGSNTKYIKLPPEGKNMAVGAFSSIKADGVFDIILQQGPIESVVVKGDYPEDLKVTNEGTTLIIMDTITKHNNTNNKKTSIYITYKQIKAIKTTSVGQIKTLDTIKVSRFVFESDGIGENILLLDADSVSASENGIGALTIAGRSHYAKVEDNGVGALKAKDFKVDILHATVSGVGSAKVYANSEIYLQVSGVGGATYYGPAKVMDKTTSGIGKVEHGE
jgi:hypothetical protein